MNEGQSALLRKAHRALRAARRNLDEGDVETATNRAYYAAFHAAGAALLSVGEIPRTHSGAVKRFGIHFVKSGQLSHTTGRVFSEALSHRLNADYDAFNVLNPGAIGELVDDVGRFVRAVETMLTK